MARETQKLALAALATWSNMETTTLAPAAAHVTLWEILPVATFCSCKEAATADVEQSISCIRSALRRMASTALRPTRLSAEKVEKVGASWM
jgi:hypothetical protein